MKLKEYVFFVPNAYILRLNWTIAGSYPCLTFHEMVATKIPTYGTKYSRMGQAKICGRQPLKNLKEDGLF